MANVLCGKRMDKTINKTKVLALYPNFNGFTNDHCNILIFFSHRKATELWIILGVPFRLGVFVFIQIDFSLAMDTGRRSYHSEWPFIGNAGSQFDCLLDLLRHSTHLQLSHLRAIHPEFSSTIHRHLFHVKYFNVYLCG